MPRLLGPPTPFVPTIQHVPMPEHYNEEDSSLVHEKRLLLEQPSRTESPKDEIEDVKPRSRNTTLYWICALVLEAGFFVLILIFLHRRPPQCVQKSQDGLVSPESSYLADLAPSIQYETVITDENYWKDETYTGLSDESDEAWRKILGIDHPLRITDEDLSMLNMSSSVWEGKTLANGGYPGLLGVFHDLHCVRHLKREVFKEQYGASRSAEQQEFFTEHSKHCLEVLRLSLMCNANLAHLPLLLNTTTDIQYVSPVSPRHCINWDGLMNALEKKKFDYEEALPPGSQVLQGLTPS